MSASGDGVLPRDSLKVHRKSMVFVNAVSGCGTQMGAISGFHSGYFLALSTTPETFVCVSRTHHLCFECCNKRKFRTAHLHENYRV
jgi:hypothetical protein